MKKTIQFILNGEQRSIDVSPSDILLDVLRDDIGIKSPKYGCGTGDCGACTVLINGKSVRSCLVLAIEVDEQEIITLEGLDRNILEKLEKSFIKYSSFQCGFCAPGMIVSIVEMLKKNPKPNEYEVKHAIAGNLCRCTGYKAIIDAVLDATSE